MATTILLLLGLVSLFSSGCETRSLTPLRDLDDEFFAEVRELLNRQHLSPDDAGQQSMLQDAEEEPAETTPRRPNEVTGWPVATLPHLGQVTGVAVDSHGQPVIFHRGPRVFDASSFNATHNFQHMAEGPISVPTVLTLDPNSGAVVSDWGANIFYLPHGIAVDHNDNIWLTDVALHQVFKFVPGSTRPQMTFGERFRPGNGLSRLCQPTAVAVATTGEIFIADGYCNSRILKFNPRGNLVRIIPQPPEFLSLQVPHGLTLVERLDLVCIADRENMRVTCPRAGLGGARYVSSPPATIQAPDLGRVFAVASYGDFVYAVNGPTSPQIPVRGFTLDPRSESVVDHWGPTAGLKNPHAIAICPNGTSLYVTEIGPNKVWKFTLKKPSAKE